MREKKIIFKAAVLFFIAANLSGRFFEIHDYFRGFLAGLSLVFLLATTGLSIGEMKKKLFVRKR